VVKNALRVALILFLLPLSAEAQQWAEFRPEGVGYSIEMPGEWSIEAQDISTAVGVVKASIATVTLGDRAYMSTYNSYPEDAVRRRPITSMPDGARDGAIANVKGKLRSEQKILISNLPGRFIIIDAPNNIVLAMQVFLMKNTLIQGVVAGPPGVESEPDTKRMLGSLKVVKP
jgi:hypothetical protein